MEANASKNGKPWTTHEIEEMRRMIARRVPMTKIAEKLQRTPRSIRNRANAERIFTRKKPCNIPWE